MTSAPLTSNEIAAYAVDDVIERAIGIYGGDGLARAHVYILVAEELQELAEMLRKTENGH